GAVRGPAAGRGAAGAARDDQLEGAADRGLSGGPTRPAPGKAGPPDLVVEGTRCWLAVGGGSVGRFLATHAAQRQRCTCEVFLVAQQLQVVVRGAFAVVVIQV